MVKSSLAFPSIHVNILLQLLLTDTALVSSTSHTEVSPDPREKFKEC